MPVTGETTYGAFITQLTLIDRIRPGNCRVDRRLSLPLDYFADLAA
jgi:hypothetical protein